MKITNLPISSITPYERNTKKHDATQIANVAESIKQYGFVQPIVIDKENVVVIGHCRLLAAKKLGMKEVPCVCVDDLTEEQVKALRLIDNKTNESEWDFDFLTQELDGLDLDGFDIDWELPQILDATEVVEDDFEEELPKEPKAKRGDIYQLGRHRLMCGDSLYLDDIEKLLNGEKCELTFTDPPYELGTQGGGILKNANSMKQINQNGVDTFEPTNLIVMSDTNIYCHNKPLIKKYIELAEDHSMPYDLCFYKKTNTVPNYKGHMMTDCEYIAIIGQQDPNKGLPKETYSKLYIGKKDPDNELSYSKPVELCAKYIKLYSKGKVLDLFGGSGSTLIACEQLGQICFMMEHDPKYVDVIIDRWEQYTGQKAVLLND